MAIAVDASSPVAVQSTTNVATSASFSPPAAALVVAVCAVGNSTGTATLQTGTMTWATGGNGTWTLAKRINTAGEVSVEIWYCQLTTAPGASTARLTGTTTTGKGTLLSIQVVTGAASGAAAIGANVSASATSFQISITPTAISSLVYCATGQNASAAALVANANSTLLSSFSDATNGERYGTLRLTGTTASTSAISVGSSTTGVATSQTVAVEILAAAGGGSFTGGATSTVSLAGTATGVVGKSSGATSTLSLTNVAAGFTPPTYPYVVGTPAVSAFTTVGATTSTISATGITAANALLLWTGHSGGSVGSTILSVSGGGATWARVTQTIATSGLPVGELWIGTGGTGGSFTITVTWSSSPSGVGATLYEIANYGSIESSTAVYATASTTPSSSSVTPAVSGDLVIGGVFAAGTVTGGPSAPWVAIAGGLNSGNAQEPSAYRQNTTAGTPYSASWAQGSSLQYIQFGIVIAGAGSKTSAVTSTVALSNTTTGQAIATAGMLLPGQRIIIPAYQYPTLGIWNVLAGIGPGVTPGYVICDISGTGPGTVVNTDYQTAINNAVSAGWTVIGYVDTNYTGGGRTTTVVQTEMDNWHTLYGINNFFLDRSDNTAANVTYYSTVTAYARTTYGATFVCLNMGAAPDATYLTPTVCDAIISFEGDNSTFVATPPSNFSGHGVSIGHIVQATAPGAAGIQILASAALGANLIYVTDEISGLYQALPSFFVGEIKSGSVLTLTTTVAGSVSVNKSSGATSTVSLTSAVAGSTGTSSGATSTISLAATASGVVGTSSGATSTISLAATAAGSGSKSSGATSTVSITGTAAGSVNKASGATSTISLAATASGVVGVVHMFEGFESGRVPSDITTYVGGSVVSDYASTGVYSMRGTGNLDGWQFTGSRFQVTGDFDIQYDLNINPDGTAARDIANFGFWLQSPGSNAVTGFLYRLDNFTPGGFLQQSGGTHTFISATNGFLPTATWYRIRISAVGTLVTATVIKISDGSLFIQQTVDVAPYLNGTTLQTAGTFGQIHDGAGTAIGHRWDNLNLGVTANIKLTATATGVVSKASGATSTVSLAGTTAGPTLGSLGMLPPGMKLIIPAYQYPTLGIWDVLGGIGPGVTPGYVICDISGTGPGTVVNADYTAAITAAQAKGWTVIGYVDTNYATRTTLAVETEMDNWHSLYGINNIFFDRSDNTATNVGYYTTLTAYARTTYSATLVCLNMGTAPDSSYLSSTVCDAIISFEGDYSTFVATPPLNYSGHGISIGHLVKATPVANAGTQILASAALGANLVYVTDETSGLYQALPSFFIGENHAAPVLTLTTTATGVVTSAATKSAVDSGTESESSSIAVTSTTTDSGALAESSSVVTVLSTTDSGTLSDASKILIPTTDSASETEASSVVVTLTTTDTGTLSESSLVGIKTTDSGTESETSSVVTVLSTTDSGSLAEASSVVTVLSTTDSASETETSSVVATSATTDSGTESESSAVVTVLSTTDSASETESSSVVTVLSTTDSAALTEASAVVATLTTTDSGTESESSAIVTVISTTDSASETESSTVVTVLSTMDSASLSDTSQVTITTSDSAALTEVSSIAATVTTTDSGALTESTRTNLSTTDSGSESESSSVSTTVTTTDNGALTEASLIAATVTTTDTLALSESSNVNTGSNVSGVETFTLADSSSVVATVITTDSGSETESSAVSDSSTTTDSGSLTESSRVGISTTDSGTESESSVVAVVLTTVDSGSLTDSSQVAPRTTDSGSLADSSAIVSVTTTSDAGTLQEFSTLVIVTSDVGSLTESSSIIVTITTSDSGSLTESSNVNNGTNVSGSDTPTLADSSQIVATVTTTDSGALTESRAIAATVAAVDGPTMSEARSLAANVSAVDGPTLSESRTVSDSTGGTDSPSMGESSFVTVTLATLESMALAEASSVLSLYAPSDSATLTESSQVTPTGTTTQVVGSDGASLGESVLLPSALLGLDTGVLGEQHVIVRFGSPDFLIPVFGLKLLTDQDRYNLSLAEPDQRWGLLLSSIDGSPLALVEDDERWSLVVSSANSLRWALALNSENEGF